MKKETKAEREARFLGAGRACILTQLRAVTTPKGETKPCVYANVEHVSRSGMARRISLFYVDADGALVRIGPWGYQHKNNLADDEQRDACDTTARYLGFDWKTHTFKVYGCGMDMVFHLLDTLVRFSGIDRDVSPLHVNDFRTVSL